MGAPIPWFVSVIQLDQRSGRPLPSYTISQDFGNWLQNSIVAPIESSPTVYPPASVTNQSAAIATTPMTLPALSAGYYRVSYYARITTADPVSSSLTVTLSWTESAVTLSTSGAAMTGNSATTVQSGSLLLLIDGSTPISYATSYSSNTPGSMKYRLSVTVERVS